MGILHDDVVVLRQGEKGDPTVITVNCPDKLGLGCDLCRILLFFGLSITRVDFATDGKWCYIVFWVFAKSTTRWGLVKKRLVGVCPPCSSASGISYFREELQPPRPPVVFLLKLCCHDRTGLLHDVTEVLCDLELNIKRVKVSTTPDGKVLDLFFITDTRELLHTKKRQEDIKEQLRTVLGDTIVCDMEKVDSEVTACSQADLFLPSAITDDEVLNFDLSDTRHGTNGLSWPSVTLDNSLSPSHTLVQIVCRDYKGLLYDIMRTLKEYNIQISYGRGNIKQNKNCEIDLFIMQDGKKIVDTSKQNSLLSRLSKELAQPLRVAVVSRGPETELLVTNPVELSGKGRPLVFYDITLALKMLSICVFSVLPHNLNLLSVHEYYLMRYAFLGHVSHSLPFSIHYVRLPHLIIRRDHSPYKIERKGGEDRIEKQYCLMAEVGRHIIEHRECEVYRFLLNEADCLSMPRGKIEDKVRKTLMGWE